MALFASLRNTKRILYLAQDYDITYHRLNLVKLFVHQCYKFIFSNLQKATISVSEGLSEKLSRYHPAKLVTIPNGVDVNFFRRNPQSTSIKEKQKTHVILLFAREDYRKGVDVGKKALEKLHQLRTHRDWEVWVIGTQKLEQKEYEVRNLGFLKSDEELRTVLSAVDIYLVPSRSEGLSLLLLQALACECAVVATAAANIITHETNGLISPIEDWRSLAENMNRVMEDAVLREKLKKNARVLAEQYSLEKSCQKFEEAILAMMTSKK